MGSKTRNQKRQIVSKMLKRHARELRQELPKGFGYYLCAVDTRNLKDENKMFLEHSSNLLAPALTNVLTGVVMDMQKKKKEKEKEDE